MQQEGTLITNTGTWWNFATPRIHGFCRISELDARIASAVPMSSVTSITSSSPITFATCSRSASRICTHSTRKQCWLKRRASKNILGNLFFRVWNLCNWKMIELLKFRNHDKVSNHSRLYPSHATSNLPYKYKLAFVNSSSSQVHWYSSSWTKYVDGLYHPY